MNGYPILKNSVRIKKMRHFCWVMEQQSATDMAAAPVEAFILASLSGEWTVEALCYLLQQCFHLPEESAGKILNGVLSRFSACVEWGSAPFCQNVRYTPGHFIYEVDPAIIQNQERLDTPSELHFSLTHACNFRCIYCFNASSTPAPGELATQQWLHLINQAAEMDVLKCTLTGGEPMLHPGIGDILSALKKHDMLMCLCTNGSYYFPELAGLLKGCTVQISLDTDNPEIHAQLTGTQTLGLVKDNIRKFVADGAYVQVKSVLTPLNIDTVAGIYTTCKELGVHKLILDRFDVSGCGRGGTELLLTEEQMESARQSMAAVYDPNAMEVQLAFHTHTWNHEEDIVPCAAFRRSLIVLPNGDITACEKMVDSPEMIIGNAATRTLSSLWQDEKIEEILHPGKKDMDPACIECDYFTQCNTGCYALKSYYGNPLFGRDPRCRLYQTVTV